MDMLLQIVLTKSHPQAHQQGTGITLLAGMTGQHLKVIVTPDILSEAIEISIGPADPNPTPMVSTIGVAATMILTEVSLDLFINPHVTVHHTTEAQAGTITTEIHHITNLRHVGASPGMTTGPEHVHPTNTITNLQAQHLSVHSQHTTDLKMGNSNRLQLMTHHQNIIALMNKTVIQRMV